VQQQLGDVVGIMKKNVETVIERGEKLENLQDKSGLQYMQYYGGDNV
jgi:hypothetical protein